MMMECADNSTCDMNIIVEIKTCKQQCYFFISTKYLIFDQYYMAGSMPQSENA